MNSPTPILQTKVLTRKLTIEGQPRKIVDSVSVSFCAGCIFNIIGPSGAGKSSLLRLINRLDEPTAGEVLFDGVDYRTLSPCDLRRQIGYLFQVPYLFRGTIEDNLIYANPEIDSTRIEQLLSLVSIDPGLSKQSVANLSVGEKQRIALARLLATDPRVILLDEPTAALDPTHTEKIEETVKLLAEEQHLTVVMVSHNPLQAVRMGGQGLLLVAGRLVEQAKVADLIERPQTDEGRRYQRKELS